MPWPSEKISAPRCLLRRSRHTAAGKEALQADAPVFVCETCGYTVEGEAPEKCPVCGAVRTKFKQF